MKSTRFAFHAAFRTLDVDTVKMTDTIGKYHGLPSLPGFMFDLSAGYLPRAIVSIDHDSFAKTLMP